MRYNKFKVDDQVIISVQDHPKEGEVLVVKWVIHNGDGWVYGVVPYEDRDSDCLIEPYRIPPVYEDWLIAGG